MNMTIKRKSWAFAIIYMVFSIVIEGAVMIFFGLRVPQDIPTLRLVVLTIPPLLAPWVCGYRKLGEVAFLAVLASILTAGLSVVFGRLTGINTGMLAPIVIRALAGFLAAETTNRVVVKAPRTV
jgi:hypothetical protein